MTLLGSLTRNTEKGGIHLIKSIRLISHVTLLSYD